MSDFIPTGFGFNTYALAALVIFIAAVIQSAFGMGFGQVAAPFLLLVDPSLVPVTILFMGMTVSILSAYRGRHDIIFKELGTALTGRIVGIFIGAEVMLLIVASPKFLIVFGSLILFAVGISLITKRLIRHLFHLLLQARYQALWALLLQLGHPPWGLFIKIEQDQMCGQH